MENQQQNAPPVVASSDNGGNDWTLKDANFLHPSGFRLRIPKSAGINKDYIITQTKNGGLLTVAAP